MLAKSGGSKNFLLVSLANLVPPLSKPWRCPYTGPRPIAIFAPSPPIQMFAASPLTLQDEARVQFKRALHNTSHWRIQGGPGKGHALQTYDEFFCSA